MRSIFDQTVQLQRAGPSGDGGIPTAVTGTVAAADATTIAALARESVTLEFLVYTTADPQAAIGDVLIVAGVSYTVVALARPFVNSQVGLSVFVTPCGSIVS